MKNWPLYLSCSLSLLLALKPTETSRACGFGPDDYYFSNSFFDPLLSNQPDTSPLFFSMDRFYDFHWDSDSFLQRDNLDEWLDYHKGKGKSPNRADLATIVYQVTPGPLEDMKGYLEGKGGTAPPDSLLNNSVVQFWKTNRWSMPACYLDFAKRCEPYARQVNPWGDDGRDTTGTTDLILEGIYKYQMTDDDPFLQLRYAYQIVRLAHYAGEYAQCVKLYDELVPPLAKQANSQLYYWALGHKAGALRSMGEEIEAAYLFSKVFEHSPTKRIPAWLSFRVADDAAWEALLARCESDEERATLYLMRAIDPEAQVMEEMSQIAAIDPQSPKLDLLLAREINKLEYDLFDWSFDFEFPIKSNPEHRSQQRAFSYLDQLSEFVAQHPSKGKAEQQAFWKLSGAYLAFMKGDFDAAEQQFAQLARKAPDAPTQARAQLYQWVCQLSRLSSLPRPTEDRLYKQWQAFDFGDDPHHLKDKAERALTRVFARLYAEAGQPGKELLARHDLSYLRSNPNSAIIEDLLSWEAELTQRTPTAFEEHLMGKLTGSGGLGPREMLQEMQATLLMKENRWQEALKIYESLPSAGLEKVSYFRIAENPFEAMNHDCISCWEEEWSEEEPSGMYEYDRLSLARKLLQLKLEMEQTPAKTAENAFLLGTAVYNTSYFGHAWMATGYYRGYHSPADSGDPVHEALQREAMVLAKSYFEQTIEASPDLEFVAQAHFMAAKCDQNLFYLDGYSDWDQEDLQQKPPYRAHFTELVQNYRNTDYYQEVIQECGYLDVYAWLQGVRE